MRFVSDSIWGRQDRSSDERRKIAESSSIIGNAMGSSGYIREWSQQRQQIIRDARKEEREIKNRWRREDQIISREMEKTKQRYLRKLGEEKGTKFYGKYERRELSGRIKRERERELRDLTIERNEKIRNIARGIRDWKKPGSSATLGR